MPFTYTGRSVKPGSPIHPSLVDIAVGMFRQPRFAGQGRRWFSVGDHSLFCDELVKDTLPSIRLAVLLHDAHESVTADVPTTFKTEGLKQHQAELDRLITGAFYPNGWFGYTQATDTVKAIDRRAMQAEARVIGPPVEPEWILNAFGASDDTHDDVQLLERLLLDGGVADEGVTLWEPWFGVPPTTMWQDYHPGVQEYLRRMLELL